MRGHLRATFVAGLVVTVPVVATFLALRFLFRSVDGLLGPSVASLIGRDIPGLGLLMTLGLVMLAGLAARSFVGRRLAGAGARVIDQVPIVRSLYRASREIVETATLSRRQVFREVVMLEFPRPGLYSYGFVTGYTSREVDGDTRRLAHVFIPGPPVPTTGVLVAVPAEQLIVLDLSVEVALKLILSGGMVAPPSLRVREGPAVPNGDGEAFPRRTPGP
ncbi:MAG: DUF502 domain-containing protein [Acidobacteria bacterium]|jgi:uncharacterized membrane protein|nr:DUF502 domain-containing protein [Acidobacteriota bacterium]